VLALQAVPEHLVIVGGSYIGLEFAQILRRLGAAVTVVERSPRLLPREDEDAAAAVQAVLEAEGVRFRLGADCLSLAPDGNGIQVGTRCGADEPVLSGSHVLLAAGRAPNTEGIGLDLAGIRIDSRGFIVVDGQCRSSAEGVWAVGDCNGRGAFTHTAWNDHEIVVDAWFGPGTRRIEDRIPCYALFTDPPLARIGANEAEARALGRPLLRAKMPMSRVGRAREAGETQGFMKVLVDAQSRHLLGATLVGLNADEVIHGLLGLMTSGTPVDSLARSVPIHPTVSELLPTLLQQLAPWD
jgi:pyruvate/2-oxoglutarate dehydrogenase complex dihydrolipoamide dehydrogenase (E3) component